MTSTGICSIAAGVAALLFASAAAATPVTFKHIVIVVQETRTPDNLFGSNPTFEPGVELATVGHDSEGHLVPLTAIPLANCYDIHRDHSYWELMYDGGKMDGANLNPVKKSHKVCTPPPNPQFTFVDNSTGTVQPYFDIATSYGFANRMFQTNQGMSFPAHQFLFGGTSAPTETSGLFASENGHVPDVLVGGGCLAASTFRVPVINPSGSETAHVGVYPCFERPTMGDLLDEAKLSWKYYTPTAAAIWNAPNAIRHICVPVTQGGTTTCTGATWARSVVVGSAQVLKDVAACNLANVSWVMPPVGASDHNQINLGLGPKWVASIVNAIGRNRACANGETYWNDTAILITWSDWGGWYDHVRPFRIGQDGGWGNSYVYGFRVPLLVVSAYTPAGYVDDEVNDFGSLLRFVELNFGLGTIGPGYYADSYPKQPLNGFFTLTSPRAFAQIPPAQGADDASPAPDGAAPD